MRLFQGNNELRNAKLSTWRQAHNRDLAVKLACAGVSILPGDENGTVRRELWPHSPATRVPQIMRWFDVDSGAIPLIALEHSGIVAIAIKSANAIANEIRMLAEPDMRRPEARNIGPANFAAIDAWTEGENDEPFFMFFRTTGCVKLPPRIAFLITENSLLFGGDIVMIAPGARGADNTFLCPEMKPSFAERYAGGEFPFIPEIILQDAVRHAPRLLGVTSTGALINNSKRTVRSG